MKKWLLFFAAILAVGVFTRMDHTGTDVSKLEPVKLVYMDSQNGMITLAADTQAQGSGNTVAGAVEDLKDSAKGKIILETAEHLLVTPGAWEAVSRLMPYLRPDCSVTLAKGTPELEAAADFLDIHKPDFTLNDLRAGDLRVPMLYTQEGRMYLENG